MKALEFTSKVKNNLIEIPTNVQAELQQAKDIKVIILYDEPEKQDIDVFENLAQEQFLKGYSDTDSIYDNY